MSHVKTIADEWKEFSEGPMKGIHPDIVQYKEMKKAFYGGAASMAICMDQVIEIDDDEIGAQVVGNLHKEVDTFFRNILSPERN